MKPVADFFPRILPHVITCPDPVAEQALVDAAIEFCGKTNIIRFTPDAVSTAIGTSTYDFDIPTYQTYVRAVYVKVNGDLIAPSTTLSQPLVDTANSAPTHFFVTQNESELLLNLYPTPDAVYTLEMSIVLQPTRDAKFLDDDLFDYWQEALVHGALYRLIGTMGQPYSDPNLARMHGSQAYHLCHNARIEGNMGRVVGSSSVKQQPFVR
jgi:hypothetical protein